MNLLLAFVTGLDINAKGGMLVRTYSDVLRYDGCNFLGMSNYDYSEKQGEAIGYLHEGDGFVSVSEGQEPTIYVLKSRVCIMLALLLFLLSTEVFADIQVIAIGDTGMGNEGQRDVADTIVDHCKETKCDLGVLLGDNIYDKGVSSTSDPQWETKFERPYFEIPFKFYASLGNHDHKGDYRAQIDYKSRRWTMPARWYKFSRENVHFFAIDSYKWDKEQEKWLDIELTKVRGWKVVFGHHPVYSYGEHGNSKSLKSLKNILTKHKVDFYLAGHDHDLQVIERHDTKFLVSGAGSKLRKTKKGTHSKFAESELGFMALSFSGDKVRLKVINKENKVLFEKDYSIRD